MLPLLNSLKEHNYRAPCVIVYCPSLNVCADLYAAFHFELGQDSYHPPGAEQISNNHLKDPKCIRDHEVNSQAVSNHVPSSVVIRLF